MLDGMTLKRKRRLFDRVLHYNGLLLLGVAEIVAMGGHMTSIFSVARR